MSAEEERDKETVDIQKLAHRHSSGTLDEVTLLCLSRVCACACPTSNNTSQV